LESVRIWPNYYLVIIYLLLIYSIIYLIITYRHVLHPDCECFGATLSGFEGATENARHENTGRSKMQDLKMRDMNLRHQFARVEIAGHKNAGPICRGEKCAKS